MKEQTYMKKIMTWFAAAAFAAFGLTAAAETAKLSFVIEGAGKVQVDGDLVHHTQAGDEPRDYAMVETDADHGLVAVPELNGGDEFYAWFSNTLEGTTVDQVIADPTKGKWINISCDTNTTFMMPAGGCVLKAVFKDSPIARGKLTVKVEPFNAVITNDGVVTGIRLDGWDLIADETGAFVTNGVKHGADHALTASLKNANWKIRWFVNGAEQSDANPFAAFDFNASDVTVVAKYESLATGISGSNANETYDKDTECKITVSPGTLIEGTSVVKYSETDSFDPSADTTNPGYTSVDGSPYTVYWRVEDEDGFIHAIGSNTVTIGKKPIAPANVAVTLEDGPFVYKREVWEPDVMSVKVTDDAELTLSPTDDYTVSYADNTDASSAAKAIVTFVNYSVTGGDGTYVKTFTIARKPITPTMVAFYTAGQTYTAAEGPFAVVKDGLVELNGPHQYGGADGTEYKVGYAQVDGAEWKVTVTGLGNYTDSQSATFYRYGDVITRDNVNYTPDPGHAGPDGFIPVEVTSVEATPSLTEIEIPGEFTEGGKNYKVVAVCSGAFLNQKATLAKITIAGADTELRGNVIKGLDRLQEMVLPSDYKYLKYGLTPNNGASILLKKGTDFSDACLLGVAGAGDRFSLTNEVTAAAVIGIASIAKTAFEGNPLLKEAALNNGVTFIAPEARDPRYAGEPLPEPGIAETLDLSYTVFTCPEKPNEAITNYFSRYNIGWYPVGDGTWATFDWDLAEAKIVMDGFERGYTNFLDAVKAAREGETVVVLKDVDATGLTIDGKKVILDATGHKVTKLADATLPNGGDYGIMGVGGTFDANLSDKLVYPDAQALVVNGDGTWTVFAVEDLVARLVDAPLQSYTNLEQAVADPDVAAVILREPAVLFRTIQSAVTAATNNGETVVLTKDGGDAVVADAVRTNTIDMAGRNWTAGSLYVKNAGAAVTLKDGAMAKRVRVAKATLTLTNVTALAGFEFYASSGSLIVESGDYAAAINAVDGGVDTIAGILVRGGTFSFDYRMAGKFDDQGGTKAFAQIGPALWAVVDETAIVATNAVSGQVYMNVSMAATCAAPGDVIELIRPSVGETVLLTDEDILKNLKFSDPNDYIDAGTPAIGAARHNEYYEIHHNADGTWSLVRKDLPTHRLTFEIEGKGRAWFWNEVENRWQDSRHVQSGTQATVDYTEFAPGLVRLKGVAETDAGDAFWRWEDVDGNRLYCEDYAVDPYANEIVFCMPDEAVTLRLVFRPASEVTTSATVTVTDALPQADCVQSVWLDKADNTGVEFADVKNGDHTVGATPVDANWYVAAWATNGVIAVNEALYTNLIVTAEDITVTPILVRSTFGIETNDVEITYNGQPTNIEVVVTNGLAAGEYRIEYSLDGANWSTDLSFTNVCSETVLWRVIYLSCDGSDIPEGVVLASGANTLVINPKSLEDADGSIEFVFDHYVLEQETAPGSGEYVQLTPDVEVIYHTEAGDIVLTGDDSDDTADYYLSYGVNKKFAQKGKITVDAWGDIADGNYTGEVNLEFTILGKYLRDGVTYYLDKNGGGGNERAAVALAKEGGADENGVYTVQPSVTFSTTTYKIVDIVPGAFANNPDIVKLDLSACTDLDLWGNIIMGLENLEMIDFPGATAADSRYAFVRLGEDHNGAGILLKNMDDTVPYDWDNDLKAELLGVTAAGDEFTVPNIVVAISATAFDGNPILKRIVLHNGITNIVQGFTDHLDLKKTVFTMAEEPSDEIKEMFLNEGEDGIKWFESPDGTFWTTSPWADAEAKIVTPLGEETYYAAFQEAIDEARDGETVTVLKDFDGGAIVIGAGKKVLIDAAGKTLVHMSINPPSTDSFGITAGTFDWDYEHPVSYLVASGHFADPVMSKWYDADAAAWRWTIIDRPDAVCTVTHDGTTYCCASLADASRSAEAGDTVTVVAAKVEEDVVFDKSLNFVFAKETTWNGQLTASGAGTIVTVSGFRANTPGKRTFAVANGAASVDFDYSPAQHAVADSENYAIFRTGATRWRLLAKRLQVAKDTEDDDELFTNMNLAAKLAESGKITVTADGCDQDIDAANDFEIVTAADVVYGGWIHANGQTVTTALDSVFSQNLIDEFDWSNGLTLAYGIGDDVYTVVQSDAIVAQFTFENGMRRVCFTDPETAVAAVDTFKPIAEFQIGVNDSSCTYDFQGGEKKDGANATFAKLVSVGNGENTIENAVLRGKFAVSGDSGTVVFGKGVRMTNPNTEFKEGDVTLIVKKGSYVNDPSEFCVEGTLGARRKGHVTDREDLDGMYVIYPEAEIAVAVGDVHYHTLQDAFDLATGGTIVLFNNLTNDSVAVSRTATLTGKSFTLTRKSATVNTIRRTNAATLIEVGANAELKLENIVFDGANVDSTKPMIAVKATGGLVIGDKLEMKGAKGGAVNVANNGQIKVNGSASQIWDNNGKNVVLANQVTGLVLVKDDDGDAAGGYNPCRIGIWCANYKAGQQFGTVDLTQFPYQMYCDGDISVEKPAVYFTNDRDATLQHGMGAAIAGPADNAISCARWTGGFQDVLEEGNFLISRTGNQLVWLARQTPPVQDPDDSYVGSTKGTITLKVAKGNDYALVTDGIAFTNWMSATGTYLTFEHLENSTTYTLLKRKSITKTQIVSDFIVNRADLIYRSSKYNAKEIAQLFDPSDITRFENEGTKREVAENAAVIVTVAADGRGYVVTLKKDLHHGVDLWDDLGPVKIDLKSSYIDARTGGDEGILVKAAANYDDVFPTELDIVNSSGLGRIAKIVGAAGADGDATDANGKDGATGIRNASGNEVAVTVNGAVEVYGGKGGNGANRVNGQAGNGGAGGDAIKGVISLTVNGGELFGGNGGNGGESTNGTGGAGGNGGAGVGLDVTGTVVTGGITGGNGGNGGGGATAGAGGNGGDGFVDLEKMVLDGDAFTGEIEVIAGKGGLSADPEKAGQDGKGGKPEAPAAPTVKYLTGESVTLNVEPSTEYLVFKTADGAPSIEKQAWIKTGPQETTIYVDRDTLNRKLVKDTEYTVWARTPAKDGNLVSYYSEMTFTTLGHDASDLVGLFKGKATVEEKDGIYVVTLTDDIDEGLEIPDNLGAFKLDMQGWSITGRDGNAAAGELGGEAAITFTAANDAPSKLTQVIIVGNGGNAIVGGNGDNAIDSLDDADGDNGGEGGNGFAVADNNVKAVVVDFENGTLAGGNGGKGADSVNGNGGDGGNGGDAYDDNRLQVTIGPDALALGGNGGNGGNVYGGIAGNGGEGGNALQGEGGNAGCGGKARAPGGQDGQDGVGGDGIIPGGAPEAYLVKLTGVSHAERFFTTFEEGALYAENGDTLTVVRDCVFDGDDYGEVELTANDFTVTTAPGVTLTWNGTLRVASGVTGFTVAGEMSEAGTGKLIVDGEATLGKGVIANLEISFEGQVELSGATVGRVAIEQGGRLTVPVNATSLVREGIFSDQGGFADKGGVFLFGGLYGFDPGLFRRDPFMVVTEGNLWRIVQDPKFTAMAQVGTKIWGIETIDEAFAEIGKAQNPILVYLLKDSVANGVLTDQAKTDAVIIGNGYTIVDAREDAACEDALFNLSGNLVLRNVTFDGQGTQKGKFIELFEAKTVVMDGCTVTGYACEALNGVDGKQQLISAAAAGMTTMLVLNDTTIAGNDVSCAVSLTDRSGSGFEYQLLLSGATTIADNGGNGIVANKFGTIVMAGDLTGGYIDVAYTGLADGKFALAADKYRDGADHFRSEATKKCGSVIEEGGKAYVKWGVDERQYAAKIGTALYVTIEEAFEKVQDGDTLVLEQDATITRTVTVRLADSADSFTLDLNGKTLTNSANKLKFGTGGVTIKNGTLAKDDTKYALYLYGAAVQLEDVTVDSDIYVARGWLVIGDADVGVKGVIAKTNAGSVSLSEGLYTENPAAYVVSGHSVASGDYGDYSWKIVAATEVVGFADGFILDTTPDKDGNIALDFTGRDAFGVLREGAEVILNGYVVNKVSVETPKGWKSTVTYDPTNGKTVVLFSMDKKVLEPVLGTDDPGDRPFEVVTVGGQVTQVTLRVKNAVKGFWYQLMAANNLGEDFQVATEVQATQDGNLAITLKTSRDKFFKLNVSDRPATK